MRVSDPVQDQISFPAVLVGVIAAACGAVLAILITREFEPDGAAGVAVAIFMLAVTVAAVSGGIWAGIIAALLSSVALPLIEHPGAGFQFEQFRDVIAAVVFLAIAAVVGLVVGNAAAERRRASEREREARLLAFLSSKLLSGDLNRALPVARWSGGRWRGRWRLQSDEREDL